MCPFKFSFNFAWPLWTALPYLVGRNVRSYRGVKHGCNSLQKSGGRVLTVTCQSWCRGGVGQISGQRS